MLLIACVGTVVLLGLFYFDITPPKETIYFGVPIFGILGAIVYYKV